jgi:hypothetical protein
VEVFLKVFEAIEKLAINVPFSLIFVSGAFPRFPMIEIFAPMIFVAPLLRIFQLRTAPRLACP